MSSAAHLTWDVGEGVQRETWLGFCGRYGIAYHPESVGQNVYYVGQIQCVFGPPNLTVLPLLPNGQPDFAKAEPWAYSESITFSTFHLGPCMPQVVDLAWAFWVEHGGKLQADKEIRRLMKPRSK